MLILLINKANALRRKLGQHGSKFAILFMLLFVIVFGSIAFYYFEKGGKEVENIWDAVYWVIVTITTVGFGDITPETTGGRVTFVIVALGGIGTIAYVIEEIVSFSTKNQLKKMLGLGEVKMKKHTIIAGWNTKTEATIKELESANEEFLVVGSELNQTELNAQRIAYIIGDPTKSDTLNRCNIKDAKTLMIPIDDDSETIMVALLARKLNNNIKIVATCNMREHAEMMRVAGIDHVIPHTEIGGRLLTHAITEPVVVKFIMYATTASVEGVGLKQTEVRQEMKLSDISLKENEKVIALHRDDSFTINFNADFMLKKGDTLVVIYPSL